MFRHTSLHRALVALGLVLLVAPALVPIQPVLYHDTSEGTTDDRRQLEEQGYEIVAYENLSARGQQLYVRTLREGGEYRVPRDRGAADFAYPTAGELGAVEDYRARRALAGIVIERPPGAELPPADERLRAAEHLHERDEERRKEREREGTAERTPRPEQEGEPEAERSVEEWRRQIARYDVMTTRTDQPPLTATGSLLRLCSALLGILAVGSGGYLGAQP